MSDIVHEVGLRWKIAELTRELAEASDRLVEQAVEIVRLRAALRGVLKAGVYDDACECMSCEMARAALGETA